MASNLRARLNAMASATAAPVKRPARETGLLRRESRCEIDEALFHLPTDGLRRIGWSGAAFDISKTVFLDTETTGLSGGAGTVAFLVGLGFAERDCFRVEQYLMRDYSDEPALISVILDRLSGFDTICSFNGRNFDVPLLKNRSVMCRMNERWRDLEQLDLLYPARRTWKLRIGSCRLSRIEEMIFGCGRTDDLPGSEVPKRYFDYLKSGDMTLLEDIIEHNRQDVATLGVLLGHLCTIYEKPEAEKHRADVFSMGKALENQGELRRARELYRIAALPAPAGSVAELRQDGVAAQAAWRGYLLARKNRDLPAMQQILEQMALRRQMRERIYVELSKLYEHHYRNARRALRYADLAAKYVPAAEKEALNRRRMRLKNKVEKEHGRKINGIL